MELYLKEIVFWGREGELRAQVGSLGTLDSFGTKDKGVYRVWKPWPLDGKPPPGIFLCSEAGYEFTEAASSSVFLHVAALNFKKHF